MIEQRRINGEKRINRAKKMIPAVEIKQETLPPKDEQNKVPKPIISILKSPLNNGK